MAFNPGPQVVGTNKDGHQKWHDDAQLLARPSGPIVIRQKFAQTPNFIWSEWVVIIKFCRTGIVYHGAPPRSSNPKATEL